VPAVGLAAAAAVLAAALVPAAEVKKGANLPTSVGDKPYQSLTHEGNRMQMPQQRNKRLLPPHHIHPHT